MFRLVGRRLIIFLNMDFGLILLRLNRFVRLSNVLVGVLMILMLLIKNLMFGFRLLMLIDVRLIGDLLLVM